MLMQRTCLFLPVKDKPAFPMSFRKNLKKFYKVIGIFMRICYTLVMKIGNFVMM